MSKELSILARTVAAKLHEAAGTKLAKTGRRNIFALADKAVEIMQTVVEFEGKLPKIFDRELLAEINSAAAGLRQNLHPIITDTSPYGSKTARSKARVLQSLTNQQNQLKAADEE